MTQEGFKGAPIKLRLTGWALSLTGAALLVFSGGYRKEDPAMFIAGAITMVVGMIFTSLSGLVAHILYMKSLKRPPAPPPPSPPSPPSAPG